MSKKKTVSNLNKLITNAKTEAKNMMGKTQ